MRTIAVIPARGGSRGLPHKNLAQIGGRSLVRIAVDLARAIRSIDAVVVSSDDEEILDEGSRYGATAVPRSPDLARDDTTTLDVLRALFHGAVSDDVVVLLQPTSPLRSADDITSCLTVLREPAVASAVTISPIDHPIEWTCSIDSAGRLRRVDLGHTVDRRQDAKTWYRINGAVYVTTVGHIASRPLVTEGTVGVPMPKERGVDIDDEIDLEFARLLAERRQRQCAISPKSHCDDGDAGVVVEG